MEDEKKKKSFSQKLVEGFKEGFKTMDERTKKPGPDLVGTQYLQQVKKRKKNIY